MTNEAEGEHTTALTPNRFTEHTATLTNEAWPPAMQHFEVNCFHTEFNKKAIKMAPKNKAAGSDEIFLEGFHVKPKGHEQGTERIIEEMREPEEHIGRMVGIHRGAILQVRRESVT